MACLVCTTVVINKIIGKEAKISLYSLLDSSTVHLIVGLPSCPGGHVQMGRCILAWHVAVFAQTPSNKQGFSHKPM